MIQQSVMLRDMDHAAPEDAWRSRGDIQRGANTSQEPDRERQASLRILIYGLNFAPELTGIGRYTGEFAAWLAARGHKVRVVTAFPYYPDWRVRDSYRGRSWRREIWQGVDVLRCPVWVPQNPKTATRLMHLASWALSSGPVLFWSSLRFRPNVIFTVEPTMMALPSALLAGGVSGAKNWHHVQDIEMGAAIDAGLVAETWLSRQISRLYGWMLRRPDHVSTLTDRMRRRLAAFGRPANDIALFPNWVDVDRFAQADGQAARARLGIAEDEIMVLYAGNMGEKQGIGSLVEVAKRLQTERKLRFVFCGAGAMRDVLAELAEEHAHVTLLEPQPDAEFAQLMAAADIHLLPQKPGVTHNVMPSKLGPMMASGGVIVAQADRGCAISEMLRLGGVVVEPGDTEAFAEAIREMAHDPARRQSLRGHAMSAVRDSHSINRVLAGALDACRRSLATNEKLTAASRMSPVN